MIKISDKLIFKNDIITDCGNILFEKGDVVTVKEVIISKGYWSRFCPDIWYPPKLVGIVICEGYGEYSPSTFEDFDQNIEDN